MELKQLRVSKKSLVLLLIGLLLCTNAALGSTVDIKVTRGGSPVPGVTVYIDDNNVGTTDSNGQRNNINVSPGFHIARAEGVSREFNVQFDGYAWVEIPI